MTGTFENTGFNQASGVSPEVITDGSTHPVQGADFVAVGIAQIGKIKFTRRALPNARRFFARRAAVGDASSVPGVGLFA